VCIGQTDTDHDSDVRASHIALNNSMESAVDRLSSSSSSLESSSSQFSQHSDDDEFKASDWWREFLALSSESEQEDDVDGNEGGGRNEPDVALSLAGPDNKRYKSSNTMFVNNIGLILT